MKSKLQIIVLFMGLLISSPFVLYSAKTDDPNLVQNIQKRYLSIKSFKGVFLQKNVFADPSLKPRVAVGTIAYLRPGKMRWSYQEPEEQLLVTDGTTVWLYDPLLENVTIQNLKEVTTGTALSFLLGVGDLNNDFHRRPVTKNLSPRDEFLVVEMAPKRDIANLEFIQLAVDSDNLDLKAIILMDQQGNYRIIEFTKMNYNVSLDAKLFTFNVSPNMEVIRQDQ